MISYELFSHLVYCNDLPHVDNHQRNNWDYFQLFELLLMFRLHFQQFPVRFLCNHNRTQTDEVFGICLMMQLQQQNHYTNF